MPAEPTLSLPWPGARPLPAAFFDRDAQLLARELLGKVIRHRVGEQWLSARIIETEAYYLVDKGSHASLGYTEKRKALFEGGDGRIQAKAEIAGEIAQHSGGDMYIETGPAGGGAGLGDHALDELLGARFELVGGGKQLGAPGMRADFIVDIPPDAGGAFVLIDRFFDGLENPLANLRVQGDPVRADVAQTSMALPENPLPEPDLQNARREQLLYTGGMMGGNGQMMQMMMAQMLQHQQAMQAMGCTK